MFRGITELKGLIIDIDSFPDDLTIWLRLYSKYKCLFITSSVDRETNLRIIYGECICRIEKFFLMFAPNANMHDMALSKLKLKASEVAYVTSNWNFIANAMSFLSGTIWVQPGQIEYSQASNCPDIVCDSIYDLEPILDNNTASFLGEAVISPLVCPKAGRIIPILFDAFGKKITVISLGRYYGYSHYMSQLHPYSSAIYLNKKAGKAYGIFQDNFRDLYFAAVKHIMGMEKVDCICSVPARPTGDDRFCNIVNYIAVNSQITNIAQNFKCINNYESQKALTEAGRSLNILNAFQYYGVLYGKTIILIDDIMTTGSTIKECVRILEEHGANKIIVLVLAVNQMGGGYWSIDQPIVKCPECGNKMRLFVNSRNKLFFYSCSECNSSINYVDGREILISKMNSEFTHTGDSYDDVSEF